MKIVILDGCTENPGDLDWKGFESLGETIVYLRTPLESIVERIGDADAVITNKTPITKETIDACKNIKYIGALATGYNVIDVEAAKSRKIPVCNIPTYGTAAVSQFAFALLLELCHHVGAHSDSVYNGEWENSIEWCYWKYPLVELCDKTMGIIGFGRIGQKTAEIAQAFGMNVLAYDEFENKSLENDKCKYSSLDNLLQTSDVVSLHCPLFPSTQGMINKNALGKMKESSFLINTSRGPLIVESDLAEALNNGVIAGAAVDVVSAEPIKGDNPLLKAKNCIITPHIAWAPKESRARLMAIAVENLEGFLKNKPINVVNK